MLKKSFDLDKVRTSGQNFFHGKGQALETEKSSYQIKNTRKIIETEAQLLSNRIALLRQEELKAMRRIEEAKKKAIDVYSSKVKIEERQKMKADKMNNDNQFIRDSQLAYANLRQKGHQKMQNIRDAIYQQRHSDFTQIRRQRDINDAKVRDFKDRVLETKRDQSLRIKEQEVTSKMRYTQYHATRAREYQMSHQLEASFQDSIKKQRELELSSLESLEREVLTRLRKTEKVEQKAINQIEEAVQLSPTEFLTKYNKEVSSPKKRTYSVGKRRNTPSKTELLHEIQLNLKSNLDESFRLNLSSVKSTRNDKYLHEDWMNKDERISREVRIYGGGGGKSPNGSILERLGVPKISNMNRSMYDNNIRGTEGGKTSGRKYDKYRPMSRNKSLGTENSSRSKSENKIDTERERMDSRDKYSSSNAVKSRAGSRPQVDKLKSPSNQTQNNPRLRSNLIGSRQTAEKGRSRAGSRVNSQVTSQVTSQVESKAITSKTNVEKEQSEVNEKRTVQETIEQDEVIENNQNDQQVAQSENKSEEEQPQPQSQSQAEEKAMEIENHQESVKEDSKAELEKHEAEGNDKVDEPAEPVEVPAEHSEQIEPAAPVEVQEEKEDEKEEDNTPEKVTETAEIHDEKEEDNIPEKATETAEIHDEKEEKQPKEEEEDANGKEEVVEEQNQPESS